MTIQSQVLEAPARRQAALRYQPEKYLALEEKAEYKSEYIDGEIAPMTGGSVNHNRIVRNVLNLLTAAIDSTECEALVAGVQRTHLPGYHRHLW